MADAHVTFALFRVAAGPRIGFGHLRRATVLAGALGRPCALSIRGRAQRPARFLEAPATPAAALARCAPRLLVIDDLRAEHARPWLTAARRAGVPCASLHDLGLGAIASDLAVDGSLVSRRRWSARTVLSGPRFAVLGGTDRRSPVRRVRSRVRSVVVSLGGGRHGALTCAIVRSLCALLPGVRVVVPMGFVHDPTLAALAGDAVQVVAAPEGLAPLLAAADLAVVGGGVTLYEAAAASLPVVAVPVVRAQRRTVRAFARAGLAVSVGDGANVVDRGHLVAQRAAQLAGDVAGRRSIAACGRATVDGRGAQRVARALVALAETPRG